MADRNIEIEALLKRLSMEYAGDPNVQTIGYGLPDRGGSILMERAIIFFVKRKLGTEQAIQSAGSKPIPKEIEGIPTDVQEFDVRKSAAGNRDETAYDPLIGGPMTSNAENHIFWFNGAGTLGMLVHDAGDSAPMALSNWHVWADGGDEGDDIIQPGHPTAGHHIEGLTKIAACGPLVTSLIEWEAPSPLALGLYGGAAAAAAAAAASDLRDPSRRGQDNTPTNPGELTTSELVGMEIEYNQIPLPGIPFKTDVKWKYERHTSDRVLTHEVTETRVNPQFLLGKIVVTDREIYQAGDSIRLTAAIWDYQPRPCDAYHVVAHLIPHAAPKRVMRAVLHPSTCPRRVPSNPSSGSPDPVRECIVFDRHRQGEHPSRGRFEWLTYLHPGQQPVQIVNWLAGTLALHIPPDGLQVSHAPTPQIIARVAQLTGQPVVVTAFNEAGQIVGQATAPQQQGVVHELTITGPGIVRSEFTGGGGEGLLVAYCILRTPDIPDTICTNFGRLVPGEYPRQGRFNWLSYANRTGESVRVVQWLPGTPALHFGTHGLSLSHAPAREVAARVAQFTGQPVTLRAYNSAGQIVGEQVSSQQQGVIEELKITAEGIIGTRVFGGGGEGLLVEYCIRTSLSEAIATPIGEQMAALLRLEFPNLELPEGKLRARRCCFTGQVKLPPDEPQGKWAVYLTVQNVNHVPEGTPPDQAATVIGGHVLSAHTSEVLGCAAVMLFDHVFDVF